jgi:glycosyltransferase involved in cell wall biosynthesis
MAQPAVSVIVETITPREHGGHGALVDEIAPTLTAVLAQPSPAGAVEHLVILDAESAGEADAIARRFPMVRLVIATTANYFAAKNAGVAAARGEVVALIDGDCVPAPDWLARLTGALASGVDVVAGRTRYEGGSLVARTFSVPDFASVLDAGGGASGFNINNVAYRRATFLTEPLDAGIPRNGGCFLQFHALRRRGARIVYAADAIVTHGLDVAGLGFAHKHFDRGFDGWLIYRGDDRGLLRGSRWVRSFGPLALPPLQARRIGLDWLRLVRYRRQMGVATLALPYYGAVVVLTRAIELAGGLAAWLRSGAPVPRPGAGEPAAHT